MTEVTHKVAGYVTRLGYNNLPQADIRATELTLLDSIGCMLCSHVTDRARIALELVDELGGRPQATIIGGHRASYSLAAFANAELLNAMDYDALGPNAAHVIPFVIPAILAVSEKVHASGKDLIGAVALGLEMGGRISSALGERQIPKSEPPYYEAFPRFSHAVAIFGAVAGAAKLLQLNEEQVANAFGIAGASAPVLAGVKWEHLKGPGIMTKYNAWAGWVSNLAVTAALMAARGFTGDTTILEEKEGFWKIAGAPYFKPERIFNELGKAWHIQSGVAFKSYPTCKLNHAGIDVINEMMRENHIRPDDVREIVVKGDPMLLEPVREGLELCSFVDAQFRNSYIFALAAYYGTQPSPQWLMRSTYEDPRILALAEKVTTVKHPNADAIISANLKKGGRPFLKNDIIVEIQTAERRFVKETKTQGESYADRLGEEGLKKKYLVNGSFSPLKTSKCEEALDLILNLDKVDDVATLFRTLSVEA